ncbi:hypothetical protein [Streptomyces sp. NPDC047024]|uniref:hypothetical protein n=1 Tax=Streptomyces sp. NPDC047024 TaxID=3155476 RepID=UPI0033C5535E
MRPRHAWRGHQVLLGPGSGGSGADEASGLPGVNLADSEEVAARSSAVIPAVLGVPGAPQLPRPWRAASRGKILVDVTNPIS